MEVSLLGYALVPVLVFVIYGAALRGSFVFDDISTLARPMKVAGNLRLALNGTWRIPTIMSYAAEIRIWNPLTVKNGSTPSPFSFHVINALLHTFNSFAVAWILRGLGYDPSLSMLGALVFGGLPLATSATAYISARSQLLATFFAFLGIGAILHGHALWAFPLLFLAFISKEDSAPLAAPFAALAYWQGYSFAAGFVLAAIAVGIWKFSALRILFTKNGNTGMQEAGLNVAFQQPTHFITTFTEYVLRFPCWAFGLLQNPDPLIRPVRIKSLRFLTAAGLFLNFLALALVWEPFRIPLFFILLSPLLTYLFIPLPDQVFEHRAYYTNLGIAVFWTYVSSVAPMLLTLAIVGYLWSMAAFRAMFWNNWEDFWMQAICNGSAYKARPLQNLAAFYKLNRADLKARKYLRVAVAVNPASGASMCDLADLEAKHGNVAGAREWLQRAMRDCPQFPQAWLWMGNLEKQMGNEPQAQACYRKHAELVGA